MPAEAAAEAVVIARTGDIVRDLVEDACIPALIKRQPRQDGLAWASITDPPCRITLDLAWQETHWLSGAARAFQSFIAAYFTPLNQRPS